MSRPTGAQAGARPPVLELRNVVKRFGGLLAVDKVTLRVPEGQILALIGPNGAGKTTLFNTISGSYRPDAGHVRFHDEEIGGLPAYEIARRGIAKAHQIPKPLSQLTVVQNAIAGAAFGRTNASIADAKGLAESALEVVGLQEKRNVLAASLNVAEKKMLELARCLAGGPSLILLDEIAAGLNPTELNRLLELLHKIRDGGRTIVMVEHLMQLVMRVSDRVAVLVSGALVADGLPADVAADERVIRAYLGDDTDDSGQRRRTAEGVEVTDGAP